MNEINGYKIGKRVFADSEKKSLHFETLPNNIAEVQDIEISQFLNGSHSQMGRFA